MSDLPPPPTSHARQRLRVQARGDVWWPRLWAVLIWGVISWSIVLWGARISGDALPLSNREVAGVDTPISDVQAVARSLGGSSEAGQSMSTTEVVAARYRLLGVALVDGRGLGSGDGLALISVDGQPARPYRPGAVLPNGEQVLKLAQGAAVLRLSSGQDVRLQVPEWQTPLPQQSAAVQLPQVSSISAASAGLPSPPTAPMSVATQQSAPQTLKESSDASARLAEMRATVQANRLARRAARQQEAQISPWSKPAPQSGAEK